jgi:hypothetical protein
MSSVYFHACRNFRTATRARNLATPMETTLPSALPETVPDTTPIAATYPTTVAMDSVANTVTPGLSS